eukprot:8266943-Alexandrium_andersonii.AAC.1
MGLGRSEVEPPNLPGHEKPDLLLVLELHEDSQVIIGQRGVAMHNVRLHRVLRQGPPCGAHAVPDRVLRVVAQ